MSQLCAVLTRILLVIANLTLLRFQIVCHSRRAAVLDSWRVVDFCN